MSTSDPLFGFEPEDVRRFDHEYVWHPFTPMDDYVAASPPVIVGGEGRRLQDTEGRWYWDGSSSIWLNVHGHRDPDLDASIREQLDRIAHSTLLGAGNVPASVLAKRLVDVTPEGLERVFFSDSGATAVEIALKAAIQFFANQGRAEKRHVVGFTDNYHGDTIGAMSVAPDPVFHWPFLSMLPEQPRVAYPYWFGHPSGATNPEECRRATLDELTALLERDGERIAAVIIEPVEGAGGIRPAPEGFLRDLRSLCDRHDVLMIVDEVATGFGKTGRMFACDAEGVTPDLMCLGKGLTGGYLPVAATLATGRVYDAFLGERRRALYHGHSFTGNQLGCAVALASLAKMPAVMDALPPKIDRVWSRLAALRDLPCVGDVRGRGLMVGVELVADRDDPRPLPSDWRAGYAVTDHARELGLIVRPIGNVVIFMPPPSSTLEELDAMLDALVRAFEDVTPRIAERVERESRGRA